MNKRYDDRVHAVEQGETMPVCGEATIPACEPEWTTDPVDCIWCESIIG